MLLADKGLTQNCDEPAVRQLLLHLYTAIDIYRYMTQAEKNEAGRWYRMFKTSFSLRNFLKERKRHRERKNPPCTPLIRKGLLEKGYKISLSVGRDGEALDERKKKFWAELEQYIGKYNRQMVLQFYYYWAEEMKGVDQMRWEIQKSWNTSYRLAAWSKRSFAKNDQAAELRLAKAKGKQQAKEADTAEQQAIAAKREQDNARLEQEMEQSKQNQMLTDEYLAKNPNGFLAQVARERQAREKKSTQKDCNATLRSLVEEPSPLCTFEKSMKHEKG